MEKIAQLEAAGKLTGVLDGGSYVYVSEEEMKSIAALIKAKGRLPLATATAEVNRLLGFKAPAQ